MSPSAEREFTTNDTMTSGRQQHCSSSSSISLDSGNNSNDRGRSIAKGGVITP